MIRQLLIFLMLIVGAPSVTVAASFDCNKATTETEIAICADFDLSVDDRIIAFLFSKHLEWRKGKEGWFDSSEELIEVPAKKIREDQKKWMTQTRNRCSADLDCLAQSMDARIDYYLNLVRLEKPNSGTNWQVYIRSLNNSKNALRLLGGILENVQRHCLAPNFSATNFGFL